MALHIMLISTMSSRVNNARNTKKVSMTEPELTSDTATHVGSMSG